MVKYSIIIAAYNASKYIESCIKSALLQSNVNIDFEIIVVDDGSTDLTANIVRRLKTENDENEARIRYIYQKNEGPFMARRNGAIHSTGDYLLFLDADDALTNDCLSIIDKAKSSYGSPDIIIFKDNEWDGHNLFKSRVDSYFKETQLINNKIIVYQDILAYKIPSSLRVKAVKRQIFINSMAEIEISRVSGIKTAEDLLQTLPLVTYSQSILYLDQHIYLYRINNDSIMHTFRKNHFFDAEKVYIFFEHYVKQWGMYYGAYKDQFIKRFFNEVYSCIIQLNLQSCTLNHKEKKDYLKNISNNELFIKYYNEMSDKKILGKGQAILLILLKLKYYNLCLAVSKLDALH